MVGVLIFLCFWHVRRCWLKHLIRKVLTWVRRKEIFRRLGDLMYMRAKPGQTREEFQEAAKAKQEEFTASIQDEEIFLEYYQRTWGHKAGKYPLLIRGINNQSFIETKSCI